MNNFIRFLGDRIIGGRPVELSHISVAIDSGVADTFKPIIRVQPDGEGARQITSGFTFADNFLLFILR